MFDMVSPGLQRQRPKLQEVLKHVIAEAQASGGFLLLTVLLVHCNLHTELSCTVPGMRCFSA
jgi:hypothetical protein